MKKSVAAVVFSLILGPLVALVASPAAAAAPTVSSVVRTGSIYESGSVSGGYSITIEGTGFCAAGSSVVTGATLGSLTLTSVAVTCGSPDSISASVPAQSLANREIGRFPVVVTTDAPSTDAIYFSLIPDVDATYAATQQTELVQLGDLFSRTQRQSITRSTSAPYTVTGTDFLTGEKYTYITNYNYLVDLDCSDPNDAEDCGAYTHEPDLGEAVHDGSLSPVVLTNLDPSQDLIIETGVTKTNLSGYLSNNTVDTASSGSMAAADWVGDRTVTELFSALDCSPDVSQGDTSTTNGERGDLDPNNLFDSGDGDGAKYTYCAGFGPDLYSEPFVAAAGKSLAFEWAAIGESDDYAVYAYLVKVDSATGAIPVSATAENHELVMYNSGSRNGTSDWTTSTADVAETGTYRFRFINGSYDGTGGYALGSLFYLNSFFLSGDTNTITFGPFDDQVVTATDTFVVNSTSTAGGEVTVTSLSPNVCTIASLSTTPPTYTVTVVSSDDTCILQATQGAVGAFAPAASVITAIALRSTATVPDAPTLVSLIAGDGELTAGWNAGPNGGSAITNYEYSVDDGSNWTTISPASVATSYVIRGLDNGQTYTVRVRAVNANGEGAQSNSLQGTPNGVGGGSSSPTPYTGPIVTPIQPEVAKQPSGEAKFTGTKLDEITKVVIEGQVVPFEVVNGELVLTVPSGLLPGLYDVQLSGSFGTLLLQDSLRIAGTVATPDIGKKTWTNINAAKTSVRVIHKNPVGEGKVQFFLNGVEIAWVRAVDQTDPKLRTYTVDGVKIPYLVRNVTLTPGIKNAFEIYIEGKRVWRAAYYSAR